MITKKEFIGQLAIILHGKGEVMTGQKLAQVLNHHSFSTGYGTPYAGGRGTYRLIKRSYDHYVHVLGNPRTAEKIALAFVSQTGRPAWDN